MTEAVTEHDTAEALRAQIPGDVLALCRRLRGAGHRRTWSAAACATCCSAGHPADFDVATDAVPEAVLALSAHVRDPHGAQARDGHGLTDASRAGPSR